MSRASLSQQRCFVKQDGACVAEPAKQNFYALEGSIAWDTFARLEERIGEEVVSVD